ncbi:MAG: prepilin peptidase [Cyanobacteria bacterium MAG IRC4_bin_6]|nr:prepilin peptidase [Cyanobacteria bacterium MAG IRC4_bin_6]
MSISTMVPVVAALLGACVGSFLGLAAWRLPRGESLMRPASHCPACGRTLAWRDNLPLLGWLWLRGRCRTCGAPIPLRDWLVEALTAGLWLAVALSTTPAAGGLAGVLRLLAGLLFISGLLLLLLLDLDGFWLPEPLCRWGVIMGLATTALLAAAAGTGPVPPLAHHSLAAALALVGFDLARVLGTWWLGAPALGGGDGKLAAVLGAWLGGRGLLLALALAVLSGGLFGLLARLGGHLKSRQPFPFGPFLATAGGLVWLTPQTLQWQLLALLLPWLNTVGSHLLSKAA